MLVIDKEVTQSTPGGEYLSSFKGRRKRLTIDDVNRIAKQLSNDTKLDRCDVAAVHKLVETWQGMGEQSPLVHYQPQVRFHKAFLRAQFADMYIEVLMLHPSVFLAHLCFICFRLRGRSCVLCNHKVC